MFGVLSYYGGDDKVVVHHFSWPWIYFLTGKQKAVSLVGKTLSFFFLAFCVNLCLANNGLSSSQGGGDSVVRLCCSSIGLINYLHILPGTLESDQGTLMLQAFGQ